MKKEFCFVILHYLNFNVTKECIKSIRNSTKDCSYQIIIVDNASNNGSLQKLQEQFKEDTDIDYIVNEYNMGFSAGNNVGFSYAKKKYNPQFIVVANNDIEFIESDFCLKVKKEYLKKKFFVAGPYIETLDGVAQNPFRNRICTAGEAKRLTRNRKIIYGILVCKKYIPVLKKIEWIENWYFINGKKKKQRIHYNHLNSDCNEVVLHGSCIIFSDRYIDVFDDAFLPLTFMYMEEDVLAIRCKQNHMLTVYLPEIKVLHKEMVSTQDKYKKSRLEKDIFFFKQSAEAGEKYLLFLKDIDNNKRNN